MPTANYKSETNPEVLTWARKTAGFAIEEVVEELADKDVTAETIRAWERGEDSPMYLTQFKKLAKIYNRTEYLFFRPKPPVDDTLDRLGSLPEHIKAKLPPQVRFLHREARLLQIHLKDFLCDMPTPEIPLRGFATLDDDVVSLANSVRQQLGITVAEQKQWQNSTVALNKWRTAIENTGIWVFFWDFAVEDYDGFYLEDENYPVIFIDVNLSIERQIFTLFHELGHVLLAKGGMFIRGELERSLAGEYQDIEQFCCDFAEEFLVPKAELQVTGKLYEAEIEDYANQYKVDFDVLVMRCRDNDLLDPQKYDEFITAWKNQTARIRPVPAKEDFVRTKLKCLGKKFILLANDQFEQEEIGELVLLKALDVNIDQLPKLVGLAYQQDDD